MAELFLWRELRRRRRRRRSVRRFDDRLRLRRRLRILWLGGRWRRARRRRGGVGVSLECHHATVGNDLSDALLEEACILNIDEVSLPVVTRLDDDETAIGREERPQRE